MVRKTTVVTMYFNLRNLEDAADALRPKSFYMDKGTATLSLDAPMVIFCDDTCYEDIKTIRDASFQNASEITTYIIKPITEYDFYKHSFPIIQKNREGDEMYRTNRCTSSFFILYMFKIIGIYIAKQLNPYGTPYYAWIDFGGSHVMRGFHEYASKMIENPHPKVSFCYIHYRNEHELSIHKRFCAGMCGVGGTAFTVESSYVDQSYCGMISIYHEILSYKMGHSDEQVLTYFYQRYPHLCTIYYGDYYSILQNYHYVRDDYNCIKHYFINEAINKGRHDLASTAALKILDSVKVGALSLHQDEINWLSSI
jgi:hypothetical protein